MRTRPYGPCTRVYIDDNSKVCGVTSGGGAVCGALAADGGVGKANPLPVDEVESLSVTGSYGVCALRKNGGVYCTGPQNPARLAGTSYRSEDTAVALPVKGFESKVKEIVATKKTHCLLTQTGEVHCSSSNEFKKVSLSTVVDIDASRSQVCALTEEGEVKCWEDSSSSPKSIQRFLPADKVQSVIAHAKSDTACSVFLNGSVRCESYGSSYGRTDATVSRAGRGEHRTCPYAACST